MRILIGLCIGGISGIVIAAIIWIGLELIQLALLGYNTFPLTSSENSFSLWFTRIMASLGSILGIVYMANNKAAGRKKR